MQLTYKGIRDPAPWRAAGVRLPKHDIEAMVRETQARPTWVHFGGGNIFRAFIAACQQKLLEMGEARGGIIAVETSGSEAIDRVYRPHDCMTLSVSLLPDGSMELSVVAAVAKGVAALRDEDWAALKEAFRQPSLQMVSFTITEKGYALRDMGGQLTDIARGDMEAGPASPKHAMGMAAALLWERFKAGGMPIAAVSMDNCSHNGEKLKASVVEIAREWVKGGYVSEDFIQWLQDEDKVSFPWSMIDKITPRPDRNVERHLKELGIEDIETVVTARHSYIAPFVNAEAPQYLVIEDRFPNGRPPLEKAGVYMTDRETVNKTERMKVTTCLNPLHTALAVFGCLLGYNHIWEEMKDEDLVRLIEKIGYQEGLPVVTDPGILSPRAFIDEVMCKRLPNPYVPDTPQRIASDTSQKVPVRFGETLKSYMADPDKDAADLVAIPLALAGWLRYLLGVDDQMNPMPISPDPMLPTLQAALQGIEPGKPGTVGERLKPIMENENLFAVNLYKAGLAEKVETYFTQMLQGPGAVRKTLQEALKD